MPEQSAEVQRINWSSCFPFTQIFRTFKMALHPGKLGLALAALLLIGLWGWLLDGVWPGRYQPVAHEIHAFWQGRDIDAWRSVVVVEDRANPVRSVTVEQVVSDAYARSGFALPDGIAVELKSPDKVNAGVRKALKDFRSKGYAELQGAKTRPEESARQLNEGYRQIEAVRSRGVFGSFLQYEASAVRQFIDAIATLNLTERTHEVLTARHRSTIADGPVVLAAEGEIGALASLILMVRGVQWLIWEHPWFALLFLLGKLAILGLFGGAICRMAALNFTRDERIPLRTALGFARRKYVGFVTAPLLPIGLILGLGVLLWIGGLIGAIPYVGGVITGLLLFLVLMAGFVMALVLIGLLAGGALMWPTIAVEGSDSFDAMSRSYSYVYSRPWRTAFYALVAAVYGAICYLFLRFFVWLMLRLARLFLGLGMVWTSRPGTGTAGASRIDVLWPMPTFDDLLRTPPPFGAAQGDTPGTWLVMLWIGLTVLLLCSFLLTFYLCASTVIYYLLRREVDATDLEDVYSEDAEEEEALRSTPPAGAAAETATTPTESPDPTRPDTGTPPDAGPPPSRA